MTIRRLAAILTADVVGYDSVVDRGGARAVLLRCMSLFLMLWTATPPARECHECGRC